MNTTPTTRFAAVALVLVLCGTALAQNPAFQAPPANSLRVSNESQPTTATIAKSTSTDESTAAADATLSRQLADWIDPPKSPPTASVSNQPVVTTSSTTGPESSLEYNPEAFPEPINLGSLVLRLFGGTAIVLAACVAFLWFGKNWLNKGVLFSSESNRMRVIETLGLAPGCCVKLIDIDGRRFAAAIDSSGMKELVPLGDTFDESLAKLEAEEAEEAENENAESETPNGETPESATIPLNQIQSTTTQEEQGDAVGNSA